MPFVKHLVPFGIAIVIAAVAGYVAYLGAPYYLRSDPAYQYLFNGLGVLQGRMPGLVEHPGTTLQELIAVVILGRWLVAGDGQTIAESVVTHSEAYLASVNFLTIGLTGIAIGMAAATVVRRTGRVWLALFTPVLVIFSTTVVDSMAIVCTEAVLIPLIVPIVLLVLPSPDASRRQKVARAIFWGMAFGAGVATKLTIVPLGLFALAFPGIGLMAVAALSSVVTFGVITIPIWSRFAYLFSWIVRLGTRQGQYGEGPEGLPPVATLWHAAAKLATGEPAWLFGCGLFLLGLILVRNGDPERRCWVRLFLIGLAVILIQMAIASLRPVYHYLVPSLIVIAILAPWVLSFRPKIVGNVIGTIVVAAFYHWSGGLPDARASHRTLVAFDALAEIAARQNCRLVPFYLSVSREFALDFGDVFIGRAYAGELQRLYPGYVGFSRNDDSFVDFAGHRVNGEVAVRLAGGEGFCLIGTDPVASTDQMDVALLAREQNFYLYQVQALRGD